MEKKKLKIAFVSFFSGGINRGGEVFIHELAKRLSEKHDVTVYQAGPKENKVNYKTIKSEIILDWDKKDMAGTLARRWFMDYWSRKIAIHTLKIFPKLMKNKYDIVLPLNGGWQCALVRLATWLSGAKMVISGQSGIGWDDRNNLWSFPDYFVAISKLAQVWAKKAMPLVKTTYIPNGVDLARFSPQGRKYKHSLMHPVVLTVNALVPCKRVDLVIDNVSRLNHYQLLVVGNGYLKNELTKLGRAKLGDRIEFVSVEHSAMPSVYRSADVFVFVPLESEAFGIVLVEAMASGLPIVTIDDPIRREIVGDAGVFINSENKEDFTHEITKALETNWGEKSRNQAMRYSWDIVVSEYEKLFIKII
ncbi:glycosyltransferase family 4 protein [Candidatus Woesebacteria bacterium]|nr:MAG: glycosyltransferase family 4 protein [Candidatus Woesebacteria bacterium]